MNFINIGICKHLFLWNRMQILKCCENICHYQLQLHLLWRVYKTFTLEILEKFECSLNVLIFFFCMNIYIFVNSLQVSKMSGTWNLEQSLSFLHYEQYCKGILQFDVHIVHSLWFFLHFPLSSSPICSNILLSTFFQTFLVLVLPSRIRFHTYRYYTAILWLYIF
jgi:hypothetical protein